MSTTNENPNLSAERDDTYGLYFDTVTGFFLLDNYYKEDEGAYVRIKEGSFEGIIEIQAKNGRPKGTKLSMGARTTPKVKTSGSIV